MKQFQGYVYPLMNSEIVHKKKKKKKKKKVDPTDRPYFFLARNRKHDYFFLWPYELHHVKIVFLQ